MEIPESFKAKYSLEGDNYKKENVDSAICDLFVVVRRLNEEKENIRKERDRLANDLGAANRRIEVVEGEAFRLRSECDKTERARAFYEAENKSLLEKLANMREESQQPDNTEVILSAIGALAEGIANVSKTGDDIHHRMDEIEVRMDSFIDNCTGHQYAFRAPQGIDKSKLNETSVTETAADGFTEAEETAQPVAGAESEEQEIEVEVYEIPEESAQEQVVEETAGTVAQTEEPELTENGEPEFEIELTEVPYTDELSEAENFEELPVDEPEEIAAEVEMPAAEIPAEEPAEDASEEISEEPAAEEPAAETAEDPSVLVNSLREKMSTDEEKPAEPEKTAGQDEAAGSYADMKKRLNAIRNKFQNK